MSYCVDFAEFEDFVTARTNEAFDGVCRVHASTAYLVYRTAEQGEPDVMISMDCVPDGYSVALSLRGNLTREQMRSLLHDTLGRIPLYREGK